VRNTRSGNGSGTTNITASDAHLSSDDSKRTSPLAAPHTTSGSSSTVTSSSSSNPHTFSTSCHAHSSFSSNILVLHHR
jgi:hypothetical protein